LRFKGMTRRTRTKMEVMMTSGLSFCLKSRPIAYLHLHFSLLHKPFIRYCF
jgi:hypothetical protein